jgi:hypothetical protein
MNVINNAHDSMVNRHKLHRHSLSRFPAANNKYQLAWTGLGRAVSRNHGFTKRLLLLGQGLDHQEFNPFQSFIFMGGNNGADNAS